MEYRHAPHLRKEQALRLSKSIVARGVFIRFLKDPLLFSIRQESMQAVLLDYQYPVVQPAP